LPARPRFGDIPVAGVCRGCCVAWVADWRLGPGRGSGGGIRPGRIAVVHGRLRVDVGVCCRAWVSAGLTTTGVWHAPAAFRVCRQERSLESAAALREVSGSCWRWRPSSATKAGRRRAAPCWLSGRGICTVCVWARTMVSGVVRRRFALLHECAVQKSQHALQEKA